MKLKRIAAAATAAAIALSVMTTTTASAATSRRTHCNITAANWSRAHVEQTSRVKVSLWVRWRTDGDGALQLQACAVGVDKKNSSRPVSVSLESYGYDVDRQIGSRSGGNSAQLLGSAGADTYAVIARVGTGPGYPYRTIVAWQLGT